MNTNITPEQAFLRCCKIEGKLNIGFYEGDDGPIATVYGDPEGLRSLATILNTLANLDQQQVPRRNLPPGEGFHLHLMESRGLQKDSASLDLGRLDPRK